MRSDDEVKNDSEEIKRITDSEEIKRIIEWNRRIRFGGFKILNTPWAKDKDGRRNTTNLALFIELTNNEGKKYYWLIKEAELEELNKNFMKVKAYNMWHNHQGSKYRQKKLLKVSEEPGK